MQDILTDANISMPIRSHLPSSPPDGREDENKL